MEKLTAGKPFSTSIPVELSYILGCCRSCQHAPHTAIRKYFFILITLELTHTVLHWLRAR